VTRDRAVKARAAWIPTQFGSQLPRWQRLSPPQLFAGSFALMILFGTLGLRFVPAFYVDGQPLGWVDALFTATSAVCVTGLIVVDTATHFSRLGQGFILFLIQIGGLGMITITSLIILHLGRRLSLRAESVIPQMPSSGPEVDARRLTRDIVLFTLALEGLGAVLLFLAFVPHLPAGDAAWHAVFQAVSAFCNAGFSTFSDSLEGWAAHSLVTWPVMVLIVVGGIGFLTLEELNELWRARKSERRFRLSLHSRVVLASSGALLAVGWLAYLGLEWGGVLGDMSIWTRLENAMFMSVTARTAGFNTVAYSNAADPTNFFTILLMSIGGSPGSTAGGLKVTTIFVIGLLAWSRFRGRTSVSAWSRTVPDETVQRAVGLFVVAFGTMTVAILVYTVLQVNGPEPVGFLPVMFEAVSAFNTVGLSLGVTDDLESLSRILTTVLMFVGRIGPLSFAALLALKAGGPSSRYKFAREDVSIG
jgi:trk system potassium uptake protein